MRKFFFLIAFISTSLMTFAQESQGTGVENVETAQKAQKMLVNGQLIILKNGIRYNVAGQIVK